MQLRRAVGQADQLGRPPWNTPTSAITAPTARCAAASDWIMKASLPLSSYSALPAYPPDDVERAALPLAVHDDQFETAERADGQPARPPFLVGEVAQCGVGGARRVPARHLMVDASHSGTADDRVRGSKPDVRDPG